MYDINIRLIEAEDTHQLRHKILRPHQTLADCRYPADQQLDTFHLGAYIDDELISIASFFKETHPDLPGDSHYRLRGMATLESYRNRKAGTSVLQFAEEYMAGKNISHWWCNARTSMEGYYHRMGLETLTEPYDIPPIGPHVLMAKAIS